MSVQYEIRGWALASAGVFCLVAIGYRVLTFPTLPDLTATVSKANTALDTVNHPCAPGPCGTLANVDKLVVKVGDVAVDTQKQVRQSGTLINAASQSLTSTSEALNGQLSHVGPLLDSVRATSDVIPSTLSDLQSSYRPLFAQSTLAIGDFRAAITQPAIGQTLGNVNSMTSSWAAISVDARKVADKTTTDYLKPVPWYLWPMKRSGELLDVGAAVARHAP